MTVAPSPLTTDTSPDALTLLFESDPLTLTDADLDGLVRELRRRRSLFASEEAAKAAAGKKKRATSTPQSAPLAAALDKPVTEIGLDDI